MLTLHDTTAAEFRAAVEASLGQKAALCYQCGKCTAGCPMAWDMDLSPNQVVHAVQLGMREKALRCKSIWVCASCETCSTRCPKDFDLARTMDVLRQMSLEAKMACPEAHDIIDFHRSFLNSIRRHGRTHEPEFIAEYKLRSLHFFQDAWNAVWMALRGKINPLPRSISGKAAIRRIFDRCRER
ncbi:MAG TPA: 4Fe-4S dicluster domain-containing protein [Planctomycetota bacterium]|nr:4Fe-4S dicluster domain-containing protein [Planctomycetota bacterium]